MRYRCVFANPLPLAVLFSGSLVAGLMMSWINHPVFAQTTPGGLGRDRSLPSQTFFEDGLDQLEQEIRILQQEDSDTAILTIQQDVQLSPYEIERLTDDDDVEIQSGSEETESTDAPTDAESH